MGRGPWDSPCKTNAFATLTLRLPYSRRRPLRLQKKPSILCLTPRGAGRGRADPEGRISLFKLDCCRRRRKVIFQDDRRGIRNTENGFKWTARVTRYTRYTYWKGVPSGGLASRQSFILIHSVDAAGRGWVTATVKHYSRTISVHSQSGVKPRGWAPYVRGASARLGGARGLCMMS